MSVDAANKQSLGVIKIFSDGISVLISRLPLFIGVSIAFGITMNLLVYAFFGSALLAAQENPFQSSLSIAAFVVTILTSIVGTTLLTAIFILAAYDARLGRPSRFATYIGTGLRSFPILILVTVLATIGFMLGFMLFVIPGLILIAMWSVTTPAVVIENAGMGALGRSRELTKGYRLPILGLFLILFIVSALISGLLSAVLGFGFSAGLTGGTIGLGAFLLQGASSAVGYALYSCVVAMLFARLKEIKEGVGIDDLADVFS